MTNVVVQFLLAIGILLGGAGSLLFMIAPPRETRGYETNWYVSMTMIVVGIGMSLTALLIMWVLP